MNQTKSDQTEIKLNDKQAHALATYVATYIQEEATRKNTHFSLFAVSDIDSQMILNAIDAYQGGAR